MTAEPEDIGTSFARFYRERLVPKLDTQVRPRLEQAIEHLSHSAFERQRRALEDRLRDVDRPFMLFIVGAGNAGKSSLVNAIAGRKVAPVSIKPLTWKIDVYQHSAEGHDHATVRWADGTTRACSVDEAQRLCEAEEAKAKAVEAKGQAHTGEIIEVIWSLTGTTLPPEVQLVDTPGIHQIRANLRATDQGKGKGGYRPLVGGGDALVGLAEVYFHRADGVLWVFDGTCLNAATGHAVEDLGFYEREQYAVINKVDAMDGVTPEETVAYAHKLLGAYFERFLPVSARQALKNPDAGGVSTLMTFVGDVFLRDARVKKARSTWSLVQAELSAAERIARAEAARIAELVRAFDEPSDALRAEADSIARSGHSSLRAAVKHAFDRVISGIDAQLIRELASRSREAQSQLIRTRISLANVERELNNYLKQIQSSLRSVAESSIARIELKTNDYDFAGRTRSVTLRIAQMDVVLTRHIDQSFHLTDVVNFESAHVSGFTDDDYLAGAAAATVGALLLGPVGILAGLFGLFGSSNSSRSSAPSREHQEAQAVRKVRAAVESHRDMAIENAVAEAQRLLPTLALAQTSAVFNAIESRIGTPRRQVEAAIGTFKRLAHELVQLRQLPLLDGLFAQNMTDTL